MATTDAISSDTASPVVSPVGDGASPVNHCEPETSGEHSTVSNDGISSPAVLQAEEAVEPKVPVKKTIRSLQPRGKPAAKPPNSPSSPSGK